METPLTFRAPQAPELPSRPLPFTLHFVREVRGWYALVLILQIGASSSAIAVPCTIRAVGCGAGRQTVFCGRAGSAPPELQTA